MANNNNPLHKAKQVKDDEFYTTYEDIQKELNHYEDHFRDKTVLCNCDDPYESNFCKFFLRNFNYLGLRRLICTSYYNSCFAGTEKKPFGNNKRDKKKGFVLDIDNVPMENGRGVSDDDIDKILVPNSGNIKYLEGDGDFRSEECIEYLKQADIVVTNPPFSLLREFIAVLFEHHKQFLIIGNQNCITYKEVYSLIQTNQLWLGYKSGDMEFRVPVGSKPRKTRYRVDENGLPWRSLGNTCWLTNLDHNKRHEEIFLFRKYLGNEVNYPTYDNYPAINIDKVTNIPVDYDGVMGVPITFLNKYNPEQFRIVKFRKGNDDKDLVVNGTSPYFRILIQKI